MKTVQYKILNKMGFHVRPASRLAALVRTSQSMVYVHFDKKALKANRFIEIVNLNIACGDIIRFEIEGKDEEAMMKEIQLFCIEELS